MGVGAAGSWGKVCCLLDNSHCDYHDHDGGDGGDDDYHKHHHHHKYNRTSREATSWKLLWPIFIKIIMKINHHMSLCHNNHDNYNHTQVAKQLLGQLPRPTPPALARFASRRNEVTLMKILMMVFVCFDFWTNWFLLSRRNSDRL